MQGCTATTRHGVTKKKMKIIEESCLERIRGKKVPINYRKASSRQGIPPDSRSVIQRWVGQLSTTNRS